MDTMDYTTAGVRRIKGIQHLSNWKLIILVLLLTSYTTCNTTPSTPGSSDQPIKEEQACTKENASFTWNYDVQPFYAIEWFFEETPIADTANASVSQDSIRIISKEYIGRFHLQRTRNVSFLLANVTEADAGYYSCIVHLRNTDIPKELKWKLHVKEIEIGDYDVTVTNTEGNCKTLKCGEPVGTQTTYVWIINVTGNVEVENTTTTNTYNLCRSEFDCSVKCQRDHDCTETTWMCFKDSTGRRRKRRSLDKQLYRCGEDQDPDKQLYRCDGNQDTGEDQDPDGNQDCGNPEDSSTNTTVITVSVVMPVILVIAIIAVVTTVVILRKRKSRDEQGPTTTKVEKPTRPEDLPMVDTTRQPDNDNSERTNLNEET